MSDNETAQEVVHQSSEPLEKSEKPIVIKLKKKKKKKRYSREYKEIQRVERHFTRSSHRAAKAMEKGASSYNKRRDKSARRKRDGAVLDFFSNSGWATSKSFREISPIPYDMAKAMDSKSVRRQLRRASRAFKVWSW
jgi:hypothetical protein